MEMCLGALHLSDLPGIETGNSQGHEAVVPTLLPQDVGACNPSLPPKWNKVGAFCNFNRNTDVEPSLSRNMKRVSGVQPENPWKTTGMDILLGTATEPGHLAQTTQASQDHVLCMLQMS